MSKNIFMYGLTHRCPIGSEIREFDTRRISERLKKKRIYTLQRKLPVSLKNKTYPINLIIHEIILVKPTKSYCNLI